MKLICSIYSMVVILSIEMSFKTKLCPYKII